MQLAPFILLFMTFQAIAFTESEHWIHTKEGAYARLGKVLIFSPNKDSKDPTILEKRKYIYDLKFNILAERKAPFPYIMGDYYYYFLRLPLSPKGELQYKKYRYHIKNKTTEHIGDDPYIYYNFDGTKIFVDNFIMDAKTKEKVEAFDRSRSDVWAKYRENNEWGPKIKSFIPLTWDDTGKYAWGAYSLFLDEPNENPLYARHNIETKKTEYLPVYLEAISNSGESVLEPNKGWIARSNVPHCVWEVGWDCKRENIPFPKKLQLEVQDLFNQRSFIMDIGSEMFPLYPYWEENGLSYRTNKDYVWKFMSFEEIEKKFKPHKLKDEQFKSKPRL